MNLKTTNNLLTIEKIISVLKISKSKVRLKTNRNNLKTTERKKTNNSTIKLKQSN